MNPENQPPLQIGDFARNKIHGYITFLYKKDIERILMFDGLIIEVGNPLQKGINIFAQLGLLRNELPSELEKVFPTLDRVLAAKGFLNNLNTMQQIDNLTYIELLAKLNEQ